MPQSVVIQTESGVCADELLGLFKHTDWTASRRESDVAKMLANTSFCVTARIQSRLVGFARVLTDHTYRAFTEDVIVDKHFRGQHIGAALIEHMLMELTDVEEVVLGCSEHNVAFYQRFGFTPVSNTFMHRLLK